MTCLVTHNYDSKPWNKANEFDAHISQKKNNCVSLKDERFNLLTSTPLPRTVQLQISHGFWINFNMWLINWLVLFDVLWNWRFFKVMCCVGALLGLHLVEPFRSLTFSSEAKYSKLVPALKQLYKDLNNINPEPFLSKKKQPLYSYQKIAFVNPRTLKLFVLW